MNNAKLWIVIILVGVVAVGAYFYPSSSTLLGASLPAGTTNGDTKIAQESIVTATDTIFSMLNTDSTDRNIASFEMRAANGAATSSLYNINCGTSSTAGGVGPTSSYVVGAVLSTSNTGTNTQFGTTTGSGFYVATSGPGVMGTSSSLANGNVNPIDRVWPTNTYLTCKVADQVSGTNALNTLDANTNGFTEFTYRIQ